MPQSTGYEYPEDTETTRACFKPSSVSFSII
nr:MAG TPA_asm: hypothetical protein [Caudoviricetes sp.]